MELKIGTGFPVGHVRGKCEFFLWPTTGTLPASSKFGEIWGIWGIFSTLRTFCFLRIWLQRFSLYSFFITSMDRTKTPPEHISPDNSYVRERLAFPKFPKLWGKFGEFYPSFETEYIVWSILYVDAVVPVQYKRHFRVFQSYVYFSFEGELLTPKTLGVRTENRWRCE